MAERALVAIEDSLVPAALAPAGHGAGVAALALMSDEEFEQRLSRLELGHRRLEQIHHRLLVRDVDYGVIPGTKQATLFKPGAEKLCQFYGLFPAFVQHTEYGDGENAPHFSILCECHLHAGSTEGPVVATGMGACNSWETKYRYRRGERTCVKCGVMGSVSRSKEEWGGGWYCNRNRGGCGAKFEKGDPEIEKQVVGNVANPDVFDLLNTVLKMAVKRSLVDAVLRATATSGRYAPDDSEESAGSGEEPGARHSAAPAGAPAAGGRRNGPPGRTAPPATGNGDRCPDCHAPAGKPHAKKCPRATPETQAVPEPEEGETVIEAGLFEESRDVPGAFH